MQLKILSWNIWYNGYFDEVSKFLAESDADIIGLQEVVLDDPARDTIGYLAGLGYKHTFAPALKVEKDGRTFGNAIFSKYEITGVKIHILSETDSRNAVRADINLGKKTLHVFSTHLLHTHQQTSETQEFQMENLIKVIPQANTVVMGDFNATPESVVVKKMQEALLSANPDPIPTLNVDLFDCPGCDSQAVPSTRLDYIFTTKDIKTRLFKVHQSKGSDHLPISVVIEI